MQVSFRLFYCYTLVACRRESKMAMIPLVRMVLCINPYRFTLRSFSGIANVGSSVSKTYTL